MVSCLLIFAGLFYFCCFLLGSYWERKKSWLESQSWKNVRKKSALFHLRGFNKARYSTPLEEFLVTFWLIAWKVRGGWQNGRIFWRNWTVRPPKSQSYTCLIFQEMTVRLTPYSTHWFFRKPPMKRKKASCRMKKRSWVLEFGVVKTKDHLRFQTKSTKHYFPRVYILFNCHNTRNPLICIYIYTHRYGTPFP